MSIIDETKINSKVLRLVHGDITERNVDAIVNAANSHLQHGGGVAAAIVRKGGKAIQDESDKIGFVPVGSVVLTGAGKLVCKFVIHAVGPMMGEGDEDVKLTKAIHNVFLLASQKGLQSVSIPAISSGIFGFPKDKCAKILVSEAKRFLEKNKTSLKTIEFCVFDNQTLVHFTNEFDDMKNY